MGYGDEAGSDWTEPSRYSGPGAVAPIPPSTAQPTKAPPRANCGQAGSGLPAGFDAQFEHRYAPANGVRLHHVIGGSEAGPLVVLLHGWPQTWYT